MIQHIKLYKLIVLLLTSAIILTSCAEKPRKEVSFDNLDEVTIGVKIGWDADFFFSKREDVKIVRYNNSGDMLLALKNGYIDAMAATHTECKTVQSMINGVKTVPGDAGSFGNVFIVTKEDEQLLKDLNSFLEEYKKTDEYADIIKRFEESDGINYDSRAVPLTGTGREIRYVIDPAEYPWSYYDFETKEYKGMEVEIISHFANEMNYKLVIQENASNMLISDVIKGRADLASDAYSDVYKAEAEFVDVYEMSVPYHDETMELLILDEDKELTVNEYLTF